MMRSDECMLGEHEVGRAEVRANSGMSGIRAGHVETVS